MVSKMASSAFKVHRNPHTASVGIVQESSHGESISTLGFGARVSEITLGAARRNTESGAIFEAKEAARRAEQDSERHAREVRSLYSIPGSLAVELAGRTSL